MDGVERVEPNPINKFTQNHRLGKFIKKEKKNVAVDRGRHMFVSFRPKFIYTAPANHLLNFVYKSSPFTSTAATSVARTQQVGSREKKLSPQKGVVFHFVVLYTKIDIFHL